MPVRDHVGILLIATLVWAAFWAAGLPSYYQQYSTAQMIWFDSVVLIPIAAIAYLVLKRYRPDRRLPTALWLALYFTVPLAIYDWLYCGLWLGDGLQFVWKYWYLTIYYFIPWALLPLIAHLLDRRDSD